MFSVASRPDYNPDTKTAPFDFTVSAVKAAEIERMIASSGTAIPGTALVNCTHALNSWKVVPISGRMSVDIDEQRQQKEQYEKRIEELETKISQLTREKEQQGTSSLGMIQTLHAKIVDLEAQLKFAQNK